MRDLIMILRYSDNATPDRFRLPWADESNGTPKVPFILKGRTAQPQPASRLQSKTIIEDELSYQTPRTVAETVLGCIWLHVFLRATDFVTDLIASFGDLFPCKSEPELIDPDEKIQRILT
ncbi:MAG: hypothetical protein H7Y20_03810 [Bryobacteraceae bacterium]|nr:hypothetical protein [Bryobacteraceae bacterium]